METPWKCVKMSQNFGQNFPLRMKICRYRPISWHESANLSPALIATLPLEFKI